MKALCRNSSFALFITVLALNMLWPKISVAQDCCKFCGFSSTVTYGARYSPTCTSSNCLYMICSNEFSYSYNCGGGTYQCDSPINDRCNIFIRC